MIEIKAAITDLTQKFKTDKEGKQQVSIALKLSITDGHKKVSDIAKYLNKGVKISIDPLQASLIAEE